MGIFLSKTRQWLRQHFWYPIRAFVDLFHLLPPIAAAVIFLLLAFVGQSYELYYSYIEKPQFLSVISAVFALALLSAVLHVSHYWLSRIRENFIFKTYRRPNVAINYRRIRRVAGVVLAFSPWLGLAVGLALAAFNIVQHQQLLNSAMELLPKSPQHASSQPLNVWIAGIAVIAVILVGLAVVTLIHMLRRSKIAIVTFLALAVAAVGLAALASWWPDQSVSEYRTAGPLAMMSIGLLFLYSVAALFALFSQRSEYPALTPVAVVLVFSAILKVPFSYVALALLLVFVLCAISAAFARLWPTFGLALLVAIAAFVAFHRDAAQVGNYGPNVDLVDGKLPEFPKMPVGDVFDKWFKPRNTGDGKFTVFIIGIEGGGIYAAAAASLFLSKLQDDSPDFDKHVFAISAVSGGAIGAAIFHALAHSSGPVTFANCHMQEPPEGTLTHETMCIMLDDHFSPVVGSIVPDLLGLPTGRAQELKGSFLQSVEHVNSSAPQRLKNWYIRHWSDDDEPDNWDKPDRSGQVGPALVLNTTSAETGYRVAFAPFSLSAGADKTMFSFLDDDLTTKFADQKQSGENVSLMFAAIASARFPGILPPFAIRVHPNESKSPHWLDRFPPISTLLQFTSKLLHWLDRLPLISTLLEFTKGDSSNRWNFVDGGYADNSGAATALGLYVALADKLEGRTDVDLKLILLTSDNPAPKFESIRGTSYGDTIAPLEAMLSVRAGLANQAVTRACDYLSNAESKESPCEEKANAADAGKPWKIKVIKLQDQAYGLALGWTISRSSLDVVSKFVATHTDYCKPPNKSDDQKAFATAQAISNNSCALQAIEAALKPVSH